MKLSISLVFITQPYFAVSKNVRWNSTHFLKEIPKKQELQQIVFNHSPDIDFQDFFMNFYKKYTAKPFSVLVIDTILVSDNLLPFR